MKLEKQLWVPKNEWRPTALTACPIDTKICVVIHYHII